jgi:hypothetical protein
MAPAADAADTQSDLVKVCVDAAGRPVRIITGTQTCGSRRTILLDRPGYSPRDFAGSPEGEIDECTVLDIFPGGIALCVGYQEIGPVGQEIEVCSTWLEGPTLHVASNDGFGDTGFLFTPEGANIFASVRQAIANSSGRGATTREITFFRDDGYVYEIDLTLLIWPPDGECVAIGRASNASVSVRR